MFVEELFIAEYIDAGKTSENRPCSSHDLFMLISMVNLFYVIRKGWWQIYVLWDLSMGGEKLSCVKLKSYDPKYVEAQFNPKVHL